MNSVAAYDLAPLAAIVLAGGLLALVPLAWVRLRHRDARPAARLRALTVLTLFLTFDLVLFGAFTRLTDSGLGCPDWPGCYGSASPLGAQRDIHAAQSALPSGPVTQGKAWIEMTHRYLATAVGALILALTVMSWIEARKRYAVKGATRLAVSPWWATATLAWVCLQGAFGALTVTMKLYPAIVTAHLLGGLMLLVLLAAQSRSYVRAPISLAPGLYHGALLLALLCGLQIALGGWVSTNYAVLACQDFPTCQGHWWPPMDFDAGFTLRRGLGEGQEGGYLPFAALTAIHYAHRLGAAVVLAGLALMAWRLNATGDRGLRRWAFALSGVALWQLASGLANVLLGWPLVAAVAHTAGAAVLVTMLTIFITRARQGRRTAHSRAFAAGHLRPAS
ncbi:MAG: COX15/CtaA family protein [Rhizobacter sp.]|nr:COX15/CtaA family protein [Rhizobacter sp.]